MNILNELRKWRENRYVLWAFMHGHANGKTITRQQKKYIQKTLAQRIKRVRRWHKITGRISMVLRNVFIKPLHYPLRPLPVAWYRDFGEDSRSYPHCPKCGEYTYRQSHCIFCGRRFIWQDKETTHTMS